MKHLIQLLLCIIDILSNYAGFSQETVNGSFEMINREHMPRGWAAVNTGSRYIVRIDSLQKHNGSVSVLIDGRTYANASADSNAAVYNGYGMMSYQKIKSIEITGWIKLQANQDSIADIFVQSATGDTIIKAFANTIKKVSQWQPVTLRFSPDSNHNWYGFYYGVEVTGRGMAWFDDISVKVNGTLIKDPVSTMYEPTAANIRWLNANIHPLSSVNAGRIGSDMNAIGKLCDGAAVVGIGEPTHGTGEALRFKLKLLQYLVTEKSFATIALEENIAVCDRMNAIINNPYLSVKDSLLKLPFYKLWKSEEIAAMLQWLQIYNASHTKKVKFIGIDEEDFLIKTTRQELRDYGTKKDSHVLHGTLLIDSALATLRFADSSRAGDSLIKASANNLSLQLTNMDSLLNSEAKESGSDKELFFTLESYVRVCRQWLQVKFFEGNRDSCMADNIRFYQLHQPADKMLVWAHNFHVSSYSAEMKTMGAYLKERYGKTYKAICFTSSQGSYVAAEDRTLQKWNTYSFEPAYRGTCEYILAKAKDSLYFLPMKDAVQNKEAAWLNMPIKHLDISYIKANSESDYKYAGIMSQLFDGIVFCKTTFANHSYMITN